MSVIRIEALPPEITSKPIQAAADNLARLSAEEITARRDLARLEDGRRGALAADRAAYAEALAGGKSDPGTAALDEHDARIREARRRTEALAVAVERASDDLAGAMEKHGPAWDKQVSAELAEARTAYAAAVEAMAAARQRVGVLAATLGFIESGGRQRVFRSALPITMPSLVGRNGEGMLADAVIDALRSEASPPAPPPPPPPEPRPAPGWPVTGLRGGD